MDVLVLYSFILCLPEDGDLSLKHMGEFIYTEDLWFCIKCVHLLVYEGDPESVFFPWRGRERTVYDILLLFYYIDYPM